ncbi:MAG: molecular chaperone [Legionella sp.]|nr:molecular chaperone [Legionella sp.]
MDKDKLLTGVIIEEIKCIDICNQYNVSKELLMDMLEEGLFNIQPDNVKKLSLDPMTVQRIETAIRLHKDLRINVPGVVLAVELLEKMDALYKELDILRKHF